MSSHYKFEVRLKTPAERDDEDEVVRQFADRVRVLAESWRAWQEVDVEIDISEVERN